MIKQTIKSSLLLCLSAFAFLQVQAQTDYKVMNATNEEGKTLGVDINNYDKTKITFSGEEMTVIVDGRQKTMNNFFEGDFTFCDTLATSTAKVSSVGLATFCSPMDVRKPEDLEVYKVTELGKDGVKMEELTQTIFPMGEGLLLKGAAGSYAFTQTLFPDDEAEDINDNILIGTLKETEFAASSVFTLSRNRDTKEVGFWRYSGTSIKAGSAYIEGSSVSWDETTGINATNGRKNASIQYNLAGQRVSRGYKGIVITTDGKKYIK